MSGTLETAAPADTAARLDVVLRDLEILSPTRFQLGGGPVMDVAAVPGMPAPAGAAPAGEDAPLENALTAVLYMLAYTAVYRGGPADAPGARVTPDAGFTARLAAANPTTTRWEPGWRVFGLLAGGAVSVNKGEVSMAAQPGQYAFAPGAGRLPAVGDVVELLAPRESLVVQPGMYYAFGDTLGSDYDFAAISRLYFNVPAQNAPWLLRTLGALLNRHQVPYRMKCSVDPAHFGRTDGFVLYVARRFVPVILRLIAPLAGEIERHLQPGTPLFSKPLLRGMGAADDPGTGESFGQSRCRLVAAGAIDAWRAGAAEVDARREAVASRFRRAGLSLDAPHLSAGTTDLYDLSTPAAETR